MPQRSRVAVVVPVYKANPTDDEKLSFAVCTRVLRNHKTILVAPDNLDVEWYKQQASDVDLGIERFPASDFSSVGTYSALLLSRRFYRRFVSFDYILLYQLDAFVFADRLLEWCDAGFSYIGAPWRPGQIDDLISYLKPWWRRRPINNGGGNGGLSLRHVSSHLNALRFLGFAAARFGQLNEDMFWGVYVPMRLSSFRIADVETCARFSIELAPTEFLKMLKGEFPFGCHAWPQINSSVWLEHLVKSGIISIDEARKVYFEPLLTHLSEIGESIECWKSKVSAHMSSLQGSNASSGLAAELCFYAEVVLAYQRLKRKFEPVL